LKNILVRKIAVIAIAILLMYNLTAIAFIAREVSIKRVILTVDESKFESKSIEKLGGRVVTKLTLLPIVIVDIPECALSSLKKMPGVLRVEHDGVFFAYNVILFKGPPQRNQPSQTIPWGISRINAIEAWSTTTGYADINGDGDSEIEVAIIDTGIDQDHPDLIDNIKWGVSVLNGRVTTRPTAWRDRNGHGTHVAGTVAALDNDIGVVGVAPDAELYIIKAMNAAGIGTWSDLILAIEIALKGPDNTLDADNDGVIVGDPDDDAPEVISMSLGGSSPPDALHDIILFAYNYNVTLVAAAGNEGADTPSYPAFYPEVIAVGAIDQEDLVPDWSNRNPELVAPGVTILSTYPDDSYEELSGTSMACPHVSGVVALIQAARLSNGLTVLPPGTETDDTSDTIRGILHITSDEKGDEGYDSLYGYGVVRADLAVEHAI